MHVLVRWKFTFKQIVMILSTYTVCTLQRMCLCRWHEYVCALIHVCSYVYAIVCLYVSMAPLHKNLRLNASQKNQTQILTARFWLDETQFAFDFSDLRSNADFMQRGPSTYMYRRGATGVGEWGQLRPPWFSFLFDCLFVCFCLSAQRSVISMMMIPLPQ